MIEEDKKLIEQFEQQYGEVVAFRVAGQLVIAGPAKQGDWDRYVDTLNAGQIAQAQRDLTISGVVHPKAEELRALLTRKPGIAVRLSGAVAKLSGFEIEELGKD